ncbi:Beta-1-4-N-acetylgalactosaminyltransferase bre-4 [Brachionus plicatilis]|uniref:Beta-1,4-galactosyltransferase n=1 Tax=Brachionus plicatilis TaxID=10195 RepID=A0A3M7RTE4_BRAPC|nr:Beta-1-4-N-acetylgalactosaminyltransferase bre-4 [Brachionus plicatilis]
MVSMELVPYGMNPNFDIVPRLKFCTVNQFSKRFNASHTSQLKFNIYSKQLNQKNKVQPGGYHRPPLCLQEFIYYHTNDATLMKLKLILDKYLLINDSQKIELVAEMSKFAYKIIKEQFLDKSGKKIISKFIHSKEKDLTVVVIPYLNRKQNLLDLLVNLHPFLQRQYLHYSILVIEQSNLFDNFNKGRLYNTAFEHLAQAYPPKDAKLNKLNVRCLIFQDVDLIPESDFNIYGCGDEKMPRHLSLSIRKSISDHKPKDNYTQNLYELLVGGVLSITPNVYSKINGFSNEFWNWGGEDDDFAIRMLVNDVCVTRPKAEHALYKMSYHKPSKRNPSRKSLLLSSARRLKNDGLTNFDRLSIKISEEIKHHIFTSLLVNVGRILDHDSKSIFLSTVENK